MDIFLVGGMHTDLELSSAVRACPDTFKPSDVELIRNMAACHMHTSGGPNNSGTTTATVDAGNIEEQTRLFAMHGLKYGMAA